MLALPAPDAAWSGVLALYSIIHLTADERPQALSEFGRVLRPGGWLLVAFHVDSAEYAVGQTSHLKEWFGISVDLEAHFLSPNELVSELQACGFTVTAKVERQPLPGVEYPSRRCYLLAQRQ
jgi:ubiquinone/menaquinone biosynthesis C-methylase UbiE